MPQTPDLNLPALRAIAEGRGYDTTAQLARDAGIDRTLLSKIFSGTRRAQNTHVIALAEALKVPRAALLGPADPATALADLDGAA